MRQQPKFQPIVKSDFSRILRGRVNDYFKQNGISTHANGAMVFRTIVLIAVWMGLYFTLLFVNLPLWLFYLGWAVFGAVVSLVALNIGHDAIHGAYTKKKWLKDLLSHTFNLNGASAYMWKVSHNHAHHNYTNIHGHDEDISPGDILRISPSTPLLKIHRFQHIYAFFFYFLATLSWVFAKDYKQFFENKINNYTGKKHPTREYFYLFFYKVLYYSLFIVLPLLVMPYHWGHIIGGFVTMHLVSGAYLAIIFMLAHAVEEVHFPLPDDSGVIEDDWMVHQLMTSANFSTQSRLASFLSGGLNQQIEHHLFANICSIHYHDLAKIVKSTAQEYGVPYYELPSFGAAIRSHYRFLKNLGHNQEYSPKSPKSESAKLAYA